MTRMSSSFVPAAALALGLSVSGQAQPGGFRGGFPGRGIQIQPVQPGANPGEPGGNGAGWLWGQGATPQWATDLKSALGQQKPVIVYVHAPAETEAPGWFRNSEIARASRETAVFVRVPLKESDPFLKEINLRAAPALLALDANGNEWRRVPNPSQSAVLATLRAASEEIAKYVDWLDKSLEQAKAREDKGDERGALFAYRKLAAEKKKGYDQIGVAREKLQQLLDRRLQDAVAQLETNEKEALQELSTLARDFDGTAIGARAKIAQIRRAIEQAGDLRMRIPELQKLAELEGEDLAAAAAEAKTLLDQIESYGDSLVQNALRKARRGDVESARAILRRVAADLPGTKVARTANDELAKL